MNCYNCFNKEAQAFDFGTEYTQATEDYILDLLKSDFIEGLSLLGGDPAEKDNQPYVLNLVKRIKKELPTKTVWLWTGRVFPKDFNKDGSVYLENITEELINNIDSLIDGPFVQRLFNSKLEYRGSSNQRIIQLTKVDRDELEKYNKENNYQREDNNNR